MKCIVTTSIPPTKSEDTAKQQRTTTIEGRHATMPLVRLFNLSDCFGNSYREDGITENRHYYTLKKSKNFLNDVPKQSFLKLVRAGKFEDIDSILDDRFKQNQLLDIDRWLEESTKKYCATTGTSNGTSGGKQIFESNPNALHILVYYRPPLSTVELLINTLTVSSIRANTISMKQQMTMKSERRTPCGRPELILPEKALDIKGQTPLHIAVRRGCDVDVVARLLRVQLENPSRSTSEDDGYGAGVPPARMMDRMQRFPLHWACCMDIPTPSSSSDSASAGRMRLGGNGAGGATTNDFIENMVAVVHILIREYPHAVVMDDVNQKTPLDLAYDNRLDKRILWSLFKVAGEITSGALYGMDAPSSVAHSTVRGNNISNHHSNHRSNRRFASSQQSTAQMSFSTMTDDLSSIFSVPVDINGDDENVSETSLSDSVSSIGEGGVSVYRPENIKHEPRTFLSW